MAREEQRHEDTVTGADSVVCADAAAGARTLAQARVAHQVHLLLVHLGLRHARQLLRSLRQRAGLGQAAAQRARRGCAGRLQGALQRARRRERQPAKTGTAVRRRPEWWPGQRRRGARVPCARARAQAMRARALVPGTPRCAAALASLSKANWCCRSQATPAASSVNVGHRAALAKQRPCRPARAQSGVSHRQPRARGQRATWAAVAAAAAARLAARRQRPAHPGCAPARSRTVAARSSARSAQS